LWPNAASQPPAALGMETPDDDVVVGDRETRTVVAQRRKRAHAFTTPAFVYLPRGLGIS